MECSRQMPLLTVVALLAGGSFAAGDGTTLERLRATLHAAQRGVEDGHYEEAGKLFRQAVHEATGLGDPNLPLARAIDGLADVQRLTGRLDEAADLYLRSSRMWETLLGEQQPRLATTLHNLAMVYMAQGHPERATPQLGRALSIWEATLGASSPQAVHTRRALRQLSPQ
jgi:tetratricopeptide (TPR) repeat protein